MNEVTIATFLIGAAVALLIIDSLFPPQHTESTPVTKPLPAPFIPPLRETPPPRTTDAVPYNSDYVTTMMVIVMVVIVVTIAVVVAIVMMRRAQKRVVVEVPEIVTAYETFIKEMTTLLRALSIHPDDASFHYFLHHLHIGYRDDKTPYFLTTEDEYNIAKMRVVEESLFNSTADTHAALRHFQNSAIPAFVAKLSVMPSNYQFIVPDYRTDISAIEHIQVTPHHHPTISSNYNVLYASTAAIYDTTTKKYVRAATVVALPLVTDNIHNLLYHQRLFHLHAIQVAKTFFTINDKNYNHSVLIAKIRDVLIHKQSHDDKVTFSYAERKSDGDEKQLGNIYGITDENQIPKNVQQEFRTLVQRYADMIRSIGEVMTDGVEVVFDEEELNRLFKSGYAVDVMQNIDNSNTSSFIFPAVVATMNDKRFLLKKMYVARS